MEEVGRALLDGRDPQARIPLTILAFEKEPEVLAGYENRLFILAGVLIAHHCHFRPVAGVRLAFLAGDVKASLAIGRNRQEDVQRGLVGVEMSRDRARRRSVVRSRKIE